MFHFNGADSIVNLQQRHWIIGTFIVIVLLSTMHVFKIYYNSFLKKKKDNKDKHLHLIFFFFFLIPTITSSGTRFFLGGGGTCIEGEKCITGGKKSKNLPKIADF